MAHPTLLVALSNALAAQATRAALYTTVPASDTTPGTEVSGGSPAYARQVIGWGGANETTGVLTGITTFPVPTGQTIRGVGLYTSGGTLLKAVAVTAVTTTEQSEVDLTVTVTPGA